MKRMIVVGLGLAGLWWLWPSAGRDPVTTRATTVQAAVLPDGFAASERTSALRVHELDEDAAPQRTVEIKGLPEETRLVGTSVGAALVWQTGKTIAMALVGDVGHPRSFGKHAVKLCSQAASNHELFGFAWVERDGALWFVRGPASASSDATAQQVIDDGLSIEARVPDYCAVASAGDKLAFVWRAGGKVSLLRCGKHCDSKARDVKLERGRELLGVGCTQQACIVATRKDRATYAHWIDAKGKVAWTKPLPDATSDTAVSIVGTGTQLAIAYQVGGAPVVRVAARSGELRAIWQGHHDADAAPALAWSGASLLVAYRHDGELETALLRP